MIIGLYPENLKANSLVFLAEYQTSGFSFSDSCMYGVMSLEKLHLLSLE